MQRTMSVLAACLAVGSFVGIATAASESETPCEQNACYWTTGNCAVTVDEFACKETIEGGLNWCRTYSC
jgi:hypothetical protein